jgi:16S rRNA processing protein RimM
MASRATSSQATPARVVLGQVAGAHGVRGQLRIAVLGDDPENLASAPWVELSFDREAPAEDRAARRYEVTFAGSGRAGELRLGLAGVGDRDAADALRGAYVLGDAALLAPLADGEHYWFELVGCTVVDDAGRELGTLAEIWETGAHDVLVVQAGDGRRHLIPAAEPFLVRVDPAERRIVVAPVPGLLDGDPAAG